MKKKAFLLLGDYTDLEAKTLGKTATDQARRAELYLMSYYQR